MEATWTESYYHALEFFYWEPQHLGRKKHIDSKLNSLKKVQSHLRVMEVTLNHNLNLFFLLAPESVRTQLFTRLFDRALSCDHRMHGRDVGEAYSLASSTQPDFFFTSDSSVVAIEMKIGAKSSISQVLKYVLLGLAEELESGRQKVHHLGFLGRGDFASQWKERFRDPAELKKAATQADLALFLSRQPSRLNEHLPRFTEILANLHIGFSTYADFALFLEAAQPPASDGSEGASVYRKLIQGVVGEFKHRKLA
jgi:hypothetical protein